MYRTYQKLFLHAVRLQKKIMPEKIISILLGSAAIGLIAWKFKGTPLCMP